MISYGLGSLAYVYQAAATFNSTLDNGTFFSYNGTGFGQISNSSDTAIALGFESNYNDGSIRHAEIHFNIAGPSQSYVRPFAVDYHLTGAAANTIFDVALLSHGTVTITSPITQMIGDGTQDILRIYSGATKKSYFRSDGLPVTTGYFIVRKSDDSQDNAYLYSGAANECSLAAAQSGGAVKLYSGASAIVAFTASAATFEDGVNLTFGGTTGTKIGGAGSKIGLYGATPVALQTGVAVTAAAIHAALVNLGAITA